ncbi:N-acetylglucosamine-6-phosphate deacetylase [Pseudonocardia humida]|uniref:Amidohydrolase family protein n=1 Tax=Pseudonocardia humida TaxID=2800819 RepID=A0ABT1AAP7_9PSEU|nr:amidohydrolase family protein [Pseudonocardia humida]MCO1660122.1 amidohydrolase family protein [Pseudonocardia humida]
MTAGQHLLRGTLVSAGRLIDDGLVAVRGDRIEFAGPTAGWSGPRPPEPAGTLLPGLVDVHCHGGAGHGFPDSDRAGVRAAAEHHLRHGTTSLVGSLVSARAEVLRERVRLLAPLVVAGELAGIHLEGPFLSAARCGAQDPRMIVPGDPDLLRELIEAGGGTVRSMTLAPETARYAELVKTMAEHDVLPSLGHTDAGAGLTREAIGEVGGGPLSATHLFNGMPPMHHRAPGPVAACLAAAARGEMVLELVADGVHLDDETVAAVFDLVGPRRIALVTDAMAAAGQADGRYRLGSLLTDVVQGVARLAGDPPGAIAGGTSRLIDVVRRVVRHSGVGLADAVTAASATPARLLGLADVGDLVAGRRADLVLTDDDLTPVAVMRAGHWVHSEPGREAV